MTTRHHPGTEDWAFTPPPPDQQPEGWVRGSAAILRLLALSFPDRDVGPGTLFALLLSRHAILVGTGRLRGLAADLDLPPPERVLALDSLAGGLRDGRPEGTDAFACLLVAVRAGPDSLRDSDIRWWSAFRHSCRRHGLRPADVLVSAPEGWLTVRAGTVGPGDWPPALAAALPAELPWPAAEVPASATEAPWSTEPAAAEPGTAGGPASAAV